MLKQVAFLVPFIVGIALPAAAQNPKISGEGLLAWYATTTPPEVTCAGGEPAEGFPPCSPDTARILSRREVQTWGGEAMSVEIAPFLDGPLTFVVNCNFSPEMRGPCWGTFSWVSGEGAWEGTWTSPLMDLVTFESRVMMVGFGVGGAIDGQQLKIEASSNPGDWYIAFKARIH